MSPSPRARKLPVGTGIFTVAANPAISSVTPNSGVQGQTLNVNILGSNAFWTAATTVSMGAGITVNSTTLNNPNSITVNVSIDPLTALGSRTVTTTTGATILTAVNAFTVNAGPAAISSLVPNNGQQGQGLAVVVTGASTHFSQGTTTVSFGAGITPGAITVTSATSLTVNIAIDPAAAIGARTVTATTSNEIASLANGFTVNAGTPVLTTVNPNSGAQGQTIANVALTGNFTHWVQGTTTATFGANITVNSLAVNSATSATASISIDPLATVGVRNVTLTTGGEIVTLTGGFTINAGPAVISSVVANTGQQGQSLTVTVTGTGTHFAQGSTSASFGLGITVGSINVASATSATVQLTIQAGAAVGARTVTLTTGGENASLTNGFSVTAGDSHSLRRSIRAAERRGRPTWP